MHISVLKSEVLKYLNPKPGENFVDATFGEGGQSLAVLKHNQPGGKVLGVEIDSGLYKEVVAKYKSLSPRLILVNDSYVNLKSIVEDNNFRPLNGVLFDLGLSSWQLEDSGRGFSFQRDEPLDMEYSSAFSRFTAFDIVNKWPLEKIIQSLKMYGQERFAVQIAKGIKRARQKASIETTNQLVEIIAQAVPAWYRYRRKHFATKTFQTLRILVNDEFDNIKKGLAAAFDVLGKKGRIVTISFHSLEDRICKNFFREKSNLGLMKILTKKPVSPSDNEIYSNPRSRSAKLRAGVKII